jgi:hypothetical protein
MHAHARYGTVSFLFFNTVYYESMKAKAFLQVFFVFFASFFSFSEKTERTLPARCLRQGCVAMAGIYVSHDDLGVGEAWYSLGRDRPLQSYRALSCFAKFTEYNVHRMDPRAEELAVARTR